ncbi:MAG: hypothetical protein LAO19_11780 [Acidobacteriia bacterium]|nr:hypothetical protein [Terriglobia bacterium]
MKPGPKPKRNKGANLGVPGRDGINLGWLTAQAHVINLHLHYLRDGVPGYLAKIKSNAPRKPSRQSRIMDPLHFDGLFVQSARRQVGLSRSGGNIEVVVVGTVTPGKGEDARKLLKGKKDFVFTPPVPGNPELWKRLKNVSSASEVRQLALQIGKIIPTMHWGVLHSHARDFLRAKKLHNYPRSNRPRSDEKRIYFFAKVLSGFMQDIAPATATKRLARLSLPNAREISESFEEDAMWRSMPQFRKQGMKYLIAVERERGSSQWWNLYRDEKDRILREPRE